jgi:hypothetical protein
LRPHSTGGIRLRRSTGPAIPSIPLRRLRAPCAYDQFPDAFIFEALKSAATSLHPLTIVSDDKDFAAAIKEAEHITWLKSIADLFIEFGLTIEAAPDVEDFVQNNMDNIVATVQDELDRWGLHVTDVDDAEIDESTVENVGFIDYRTFRTAGQGKDILVVGRIEMDVKVSYHHPDWDTATYDSEDCQRQAEIA